MTIHSIDAESYPAIDGSLPPERLFSLIQSLPVGVFAYQMDSDNRFTFVNQSMLDMLGYTEEEFLDMCDGRFPMMIYGPDRSRVIQAIDDNTLNGKAASVRYRIQRKDGTVIWVQDQGRYVQTNGDRTDVLVAVADVTDDVLAHQSLQELLNGTPAGLITMRKVGDAIFVEGSNHVTRRYLGVEEDELVGRSAEDWYHSFVDPDDFAVAAMMLDKLFGPEMEAECMYRVRSAHGEWRWMSYRGRTFPQADGSLLAYGVHVDRTERQQVTERLREQQQVYQAAVDTAQILVWEFHPDTRRLTLAESPYAEECTRRLGLSMHFDNMPESLVPFLDEQSRVQLAAMLDAVARGEVIKEVLLRSKTQPGAPSLSFRVTSVIIYDSVGAPIKICGTAQDVTKQWVAADEYRQQCDHFNAERGEGLVSKSWVNLTRNVVLEFTPFTPAPVDISSGMNYDEASARFSDCVASSKDREAVQELLNRENLTRAFGEGRTTFVREYRRSRGSQASAWVMLQVRLFQHPETGDIEGFLYGYDHTEQHLEALMVQRMSELGYDYMGIINPESKEFLFYRGMGVGSEEGRSEMSYDEAVALGRQGVPEDELQESLQKASLETVLAELEKSGRYEFAHSVVDASGRIRRKFNQYLYLDESRQGVFYVQSDITEQHEEEQARIRQLDEEQRAHQRTSDLMQKILNTTPTAIYWKDTDLRFQGANTAFLRFLGLKSADELIGLTMDEAGLAPLYEEHVADELRILEGGMSTVRVPGVYAPANGPVRSVAVSKSPFMQNGKIVGVVGSFEDVTDEVEHAHEIRRLNADLQVALAEAEHATQAEQTFLSNMSHDMRTPLNGIVGFTRMALATDDAGKRQEFLEKIDYSGKLLLAMVNDVLDMSKIASGRMELLPQPVVAKDLFDATIDMVQVMAQGKDIELQSHVEIDDDVCFDIDRLRVQQVLLNVMSNAVKYTKPGGHVRCDFRLLDHPEQGCNTLLVIADDGIGMSMEFQEHMFEPFTEENRGFESSSTQGTGLGLSIVKQIVDLMGGFIVVESELNVGTTFRIYLPMPVVASEGPAAQQSMIEAASSEGRHVMVFEDNDLNAEISRAILAEHGVSTYRVHDGEEGYRVFAESALGEFDALIVDMRMPKMGGLEAARAIRALDRPDAATVPIIAMTADAFADDVQACLDAGMNAHISKPIDPAVLMGELARLWS